MCNRYLLPSCDEFDAVFKTQPPTPYPTEPLFPRGIGVFIRAARNETEYRREAVVGQWSLIPWFAKTAKLPYSTNNARLETIATAATFKQSWRHGQRCIIPADVFYEPNWESGKNEWWAFRRADGHPWALAGLWNRWVDKSSGEIVESYTMLTMNADQHPLMRRMHKPDPKLAPHEQDKRSVVVIESEEIDVWLAAGIDAASELVRLAPLDAFLAGPQAHPELAPSRERRLMKPNRRPDSAVSTPNFEAHDTSFLPDMP